ncbi:MAG: nitroreductase family protein [Bacteroidaceae bacterium]|nr:nitroreductase family protein [Bacteroidaceae bacterium]
MSSFKNRKTIRKYTFQPVSQRLLEKLIATASHASTVGNMQVYSVVATRDVDIKEQLAPLHFNQPMVMNAPVVLTFCADFNRFSKWCEQRDAAPSYNNLISFASAAMDATIFAQTFATLAEQRGLGICYLGTTTYNAEAICEVLKLPPLVFPITTLTVGWPAECPNKVDRLPLGAVLHEDVYHDFTPESIDELYEEKEALPINLQYIKENNKKTLAQVFTDVRYTKKDNILFSRNFKKALKKQNFF